MLIVDVREHWKIRYGLISNLLFFERESIICIDDIKLYKMIVFIGAGVRVLKVVGL